MKHKTALCALAVVAIIMLATVTPMIVQEEDDSADGIAPLLAWGIGVGLGAIGGWISHELFNKAHQTNPGGDLEAVNKLARSAEAKSIIGRLSDQCSISNVGQTLDSDIWQFTNSYWERSAEVVVSSMWSVDGSPDYNAIMQKSSLLDNMSAVLWTWQNTVDCGHHVFSNVRESWLHENAYKQMTIGFDWSQGSLYTDGKIYTDFNGIVTPTDGRSSVYLNTDVPESGYNDVTTRTVYVFGGSGSLTAANGDVINLKEGANNVSGLASGMYTLKSGVTYAGTFVPAATAAADITGSAVLVSGNQLAYAIPTADGIKITHGDSSQISQELNYKVSYDGRNDTVNIASMLRSYDAFYSQIENSVKKSNDAVDVIWKVFDKAGESSVFVSPTAILPHLENLDFSVDQKFAIYTLAMAQMSDYYTSNKDAMTPNDLSISEESLQLIVNGTIKDPSGQTIADRVIFTPYAYTQDASISRGTSSWTQSGVAIVWGSADEWSGSYDPEKVRLITLDEGFTFDVEALEYDGLSSESVTLKVHTMEQIGIDFAPHPEPEPVPKIVDLKDVVMIIMIIAGILVLLAGLLSRQVIIIVIGVAVLLLGIFAAEFIADMIVRFK